MQIVWEFPHRETGALCRAVFDGGLLEVKVIEPVDNDDDDWDDCCDGIDDTEKILISSGTMHTCVANRDAAYRELRQHADSFDLDRSETAQ